MYGPDMGKDLNGINGNLNKQRLPHAEGTPIDVSSKPNNSKVKLLFLLTRFLLKPIVSNKLAQV